MKKPYVQVTLIYFLFGFVWIVGSDHLFRLLFDDVRLLSYAQSLKGMAFVASSSALLYCLLRNAARREERERFLKAAIFKKTVGASFHILLNYLNQSQIVRLAAEECSQFDRQALTLADQARDQAKSALYALQELETISEDEISKAVKRGTGVPFLRSGP